MSLRDELDRTDSPDREWLRNIIKRKELEARRKEAKLRPHQDGCPALWTHAVPKDCGCGRNRRIAELDRQLEEMSKSERNPLPLGMGSSELISA